MNRCSTRLGKFLRYSSTKSYETAQSSSSHNKTVDNSEIIHHGKLSNKWWDKQGILRPLHSFNPLRIQLVRDGLKNVGYLDPNHAEPLKNMKILDVGCGGGLLTEPLARIGANVTGIDASEELIRTAKEHAALDPSLSGRTTYICEAIEDHVCKNLEFYDVIVASEVLEHVSNKDYFIKCCVDILKPNGSIFITTLNKNLISWMAGIVLAEYVFKIIPTGTHEWEKFISPVDTQRILEKYLCQVKLLNGLYYNPVLNDWFWTSTTAVSYAIHAVKSPKL